MGEALLGHYCQNNLVPAGHVDSTRAAKEGDIGLYLGPTPSGWLGSALRTVTNGRAVRVGNRGTRSPPGGGRMCRDIVGTTNLSRTIRAEGTDKVGDLR